MFSNNQFEFYSVDENYYLEVLLKEDKYIEKNVIRNIIGGLESFAGDSDEEQIKAIRLIFFEKASLKIYFLKVSSLRQNFEKIYFLKNIFYIF